MCKFFLCGWGILCRIQNCRGSPGESIRKGELIGSLTVFQRINGTAFVFSAALPSPLAVSASEAIAELTSKPSMLTALHENIRAFRLVLDAAATVCPIRIPSHPASAIIHIQCKPQAPNALSPHSATQRLGKPSNPSSPTSSNPAEFDVEAEERLLQDVVEEALSQGVLITRARRLRGQEPNEPRPSIRIAMTAELGKKEVEKAASVIRAALVKVLGKRK